MLWLPTITECLRMPCKVFTTESGIQLIGSAINGDELIYSY